VVHRFSNPGPVRENRQVNERRSPLAAMLDLFVYTPVGVAVTVGEELPKLAAKGRAKVGPKVSTARLVGQFAVAEGRRRVSRPAEHPAPPTGPVPAPSPGPRPADTTLLHPVPDPPAAPPRPPVRPPAPRLPSTGGAGLSADGLAIPGYDSLSASQVVQRLAGLSGSELAAVGAYEAATRGRRTILARVTQLQSN
jgi:hypothetical protein